MHFRSFAFGSLAVAAVASLPFSLGSLAACSSKAQLAGQGAQCNLTTDCQEGLVCIPQKGGTSVCSNNLGSIQQLPPTPDAGQATPVSDAGGNDDAPGVILPDDTGAPTQPTNDAAGD